MAQKKFNNVFVTALASDHQRRPTAIILCD
jgi:hypothetical protein